MDYTRDMNRAAFTAIELLVSLVIILIVVSMSTVGLARSLQASSINNAAVTIMRAASEARTLAMREPASPVGHTYGVVIVDHPDHGKPYVAVTFGGPGDGKGNDADRILLGSGGEPIFKEELPKAASLWSGDTLLTETSDKMIGWYYRQATGNPIALSSGSFTVAPVGVGIPTENLTNVWGLTGSEYNTDPQVISPTVGSTPGLTVRSGNGKFRQAIEVFPSGTITKRNLDTAQGG